jgi:hypothetical protein
MHHQIRKTPKLVRAFTKKSSVDLTTMPRCLASSMPFIRIRKN